MKLTVSVALWHLDEGHLEFRIYFDDGKGKILQKQEILDKRLCEDKQITRRMIDSSFYEMKEGVYKHFGIRS